MSRIDKLQEEIKRIHNLINETNDVLDMPVSNLRQDYEQQASRLSGFAAMKLRDGVRGKRPEQALLVAAIFGAGWLVTAGIDEVRNSKASSNAKKALAGYYQELAVKHNLLIEEQQKLIQELTTQKFELESDRDQIYARLAKITDIVNRISQVQQQRGK